MKPGYHDDYAGELDPLDQTPIDFDWSLLEAAMGELQPDLNAENYAELAEALRRLLGVPSASVRDGVVAADED